MQKNQEGKRTPSYLSFANDYVFYTIMKENKDICKEVVELATNGELGDFEILEINEQDFYKPRVEGHGVRFDIIIKATHEIIDVEMQKASLKDLPKRSRYYQSMIDGEFLEEGKHYSELPKSVIIFICPEADPFKKNYGCYPFTMICPRDPEIFLETESWIYFFCRSEKLENKRAKAFFDFIEDNKGRDELTNKIEKAVIKASSNTKWRETAMTFEMRLEETKRYGIELGRAEGLAKGRAEGRAEGLDEGLAEGLAKGRAEGLAEGLAEGQSSIIKTMQEQGLTKEQIIQFTGLSKEDDEEILNSIAIRNGGKQP